MVPLDWWPVTRDCLAYGVTVAILICIIHDERVEWYEALSLVLLYIVYIAIMYFDKSIQRCTRFRRKNSMAPVGDSAISQPADASSRPGETHFYTRNKSDCSRFSRSPVGLVRVEIFVKLCNFFIDF